jgi:hypothetical protein
MLLCVCVCVCVCAFVDVHYSDKDAHAIHVNAQYPPGLR